MNELADQDLKLSEAAARKMSELSNDIEDNVEGIRVYAQPGGCSGVSFGMTFSDKIEDNDCVREQNGIKVIVDPNTLQYLRGADIDFVEHPDGQPSFVFNNLPTPSGGGCGTCGSRGNGCGS